MENKKKITAIFALIFLVLVSGVMFVSSLGGLAGSYAIPTVLASIVGNFVDVSWYDPSSDHWFSYNAIYPQFADLENMTPTHGYWIYVNRSGGVNLTINGTLLSNTTWALQYGWNLIGYPSITLQPVATALGSISGNFVDVSWYDPSSDHWFSYNAIYPQFADLENMTPGQGYWIYINKTGGVNLTI